MSMKSKLQRMKGHLQLEKTNTEPTPSSQKTEAKDSLIEAWGELGFLPFVFEEQTSFQKRVIYPFDNEDKRSLKDEIKQTYLLWEEAEMDHPLSCDNVPLERMMFFDTETTGLSTGAGNSIFLIGYSRVLEEGIEVTQHLLANPAEEAAFMYGFLQDFHEDDYLVSYNGKAFDWPRVKSRHAFVRKQVPRLPAFGHIDLLHASRRLWKNELPSCRLSIVEKEKLNIIRENDTPGSMAPILYFDYLHERKPSYLKGIIEHNDQDVRSLINLYVQITKRLFLRMERLSPLEHIQIGQWFEQLKWNSMAIAHYKKATETIGIGRDEAFYKLGLLYKKQKAIDEAKDCFLAAISVSSMPNPYAYIELSKLAEHHEKNISEAYKYANRAFEMLKQSVRLTGKTKTAISDIRKRLERLDRKLN